MDISRKPVEYEIDLDPPTTWVSRLVMMAVVLLVAGVVFTSYWYLNQSSEPTMPDVDLQSLPQLSVDDVCGRFGPPRGVGDVQQWMQALWVRFCE